MALSLKNIVPLSLKYTSGVLRGSVGVVLIFVQAEIDNLKYAEGEAVVEAAADKDAPLRRILVSTLHKENLADHTISFIQKHIPDILEDFKIMFDVAKKYGCLVFGVLFDVSSRLLSDRDFVRKVLQECPTGSNGPRYPVLRKYQHNDVLQISTE